MSGKELELILSVSHRQIFSVNKNSNNTILKANRKINKDKITGSYSHINKILSVNNSTQIQIKATMIIQSKRRILTI